MLPGAQMLFEPSEVKNAYIMPDGDSYWDSGFQGGDGCEYAFSCIWLRFPKNSDNEDGLAENCLMGSHIYRGVIACTFNFRATDADTLTTQANFAQCRCPVGGEWLGVWSRLVARHRVGDNYLSVGFDGGEFSSVYKSDPITTDGSMLICNNLAGGDWDRYGPMPDNTVMIFNIAVSQNGQLVKNFIPWKDRGIPCFKETVSGTLIHSIGTTTGKYGVWKP